MCGYHWRPNRLSRELQVNHPPSSSRLPADRAICGCGLQSLLLPKLNFYVIRLLPAVNIPGPRSKSSVLMSGPELWKAKRPPQAGKSAAANIRIYPRASRGSIAEGEGGCE